MTRRPFETCADCHTVKWPVRGLGKVCPKCDHLHAWPVIVANYRTPTDQSSERARVDTAPKPYDWDTDEGYKAL